MSNRSSLIESLESRQLLSATLPNILGQFSGLITYSGGTTDSEVVGILVQKKASFTGGAFLGSGVSAKLKGTINNKGVVHATLTGSNTKFSSKIIGQLTGDTLDGTFITKQGKVKTTGVISVTRSA
jgi:hypothetical protein